MDEMDEIAPMLAKLGYDPDANPPNYGVPDGLVANNTKEVSSTANQIMTKSDRCSGARTWERMGSSKQAADKPNEERPS